jgi:hypothetical protein
MSVVNREYEPVSVNHSLITERLELRIHGGGEHGEGDRYTLLKAKEARELAYNLLFEAEKLAS